MLRKIGLALIFLVCLYVGFWIAVIPLAIGMKLIWWNDPISPAMDMVASVAGLTGGAIFAFLAVRFLALKWKE